MLQRHVAELTVGRETLSQPPDLPRRLAFLPASATFDAAFSSSRRAASDATLKRSASYTTSQGGTGRLVADNPIGQKSEDHLQQNTRGSSQTRGNNVAMATAHSLSTPLWTRPNRVDASARFPTARGEPMEPEELASAAKARHRSGELALCVFGLFLLCVCVCVRLPSRTDIA